MPIQALLFNVQGTLLDTEVNEEDPHLWAVLERYLRYKGIYLQPEKLTEIYRHTHQALQARSPFPHPEVDVLTIWAEILQEWENPAVYTLPIVTSEGIEFIKSVAQLYRSLSLKRLALYPGVKDVLESLGGNFQLGLVANGQHGWTSPELKYLGIRHYFRVAVFSSDHGRGKPDPYLYRVALERLGVPPPAALFIGNDGPTDIAGASAAGIESVLIEDTPGIKDIPGFSPTHRLRTIADLPDLLKNLAAVNRP